ncbi:MAG TPA: tRNA epoxyqueuosine(34) reductase QueG, partial [Sedimentisphaerales bacterium]|nr:tRNA epoxyqueuosine(34) reductase QueG [Sedimentisphaerales bacterium]
AQGKTYYKGVHACIIISMISADTVKEKAMSLGFDAVGITDASPVSPEDSARFRRWLEEGKAADMAFMHRNIEKRLAPASLLPGAKSVICAALSYHLPPQSRTSETAGAIADYAVFRDYHLTIGERLEALADILKALASREIAFRVCVDSAPLAERALAMRAGLGFIGKNTMLIHPAIGPAVWLGELVTDIELQPDRPCAGDCGDCRACLDACPTGAISEDGLDARKCLSYLTIEHKGDIPPEHARKMGRRLFGCDECVHACPFYVRAQRCSDSTLALRVGSPSFELAEIIGWDEKTFNRKTAGTPVRRPGLKGLRRNAAICIGNSRLQ